MLVNLKLNETRADGRHPEHQTQRNKNRAPVRTRGARHFDGVGTTGHPVLQTLQLHQRDFFWSEDALLFFGFS